MNENVIPHLVESFIARCDNDLTTAAHKLRISVATLSRWRKKQSVPRPAHQRRLQSLVGQGEQLHEDLFSRHSSTPIAPRLQKIESHLLDVLSEIRELFHSHSHFSSQQDCLDFIASLFFAHIVSLDSGGDGISLSMFKNEKDAASSLSQFVYQAYDRLLSAEQKASLDERYMSLNLSGADNKFAISVISAIEKTRDAVREAHAHGRDDIVNAIFSRFVCGSFVDEKEMGQYLTPPEIVNLMTIYGLSCLSEEKKTILTSPDKIGESGVILDPSCGVGSFLGAAAQILSEVVRSRNSSSDFHKWSSTALHNKIVGFDKSMRMAHLAITNLYLFGAGEAQILRANALDKHDETLDSVLGKCWLILTNPPFGASYSGDEIADYDVIKKYLKNGRSIDSELLFFERYIEWLAPGGVLVSVVPDNLLTGQGLYADMRDYIRKHCEVLSIVSLPSVTFAAAGTSTKTSILTLRRKKDNASKPENVYFGVCNAVGFDVATRGGYRRRRPIPENDLPAIARELKGETAANFGRWVELPSKAKRWDAIYHAHPSLNGDDGKNELQTVSDVAQLVDERVNPRRIFSGDFKYIEISSIDPKTGWVNANDISANKAPSRARKKVKAGDVLVSTVRPERGAVGVVPKSLDGAICTTGLAVLRPTKIDPYLLRRLLVSRFVLDQMERHNVGIAYPAISEKDVVKFKLPVKEDSIEDLEHAARKVGEALEETASRLRALDDALNSHGLEFSR